VENAAIFTTYSLRRCYPTVAGIHRASADEQDALGDWLTVQGTVMRVRYQDQRLEEAAAAKLRQATLLQWAAQKQSDALSWEVLRVFMHKECVTKAGEAVAAQLMNDEIVEHVDETQQPRARFAIRHLQHRAVGKPVTDAPCLPLQPEAPPPEVRTEELQQSWLATLYKGDALVHLMTKEGRTLCKHRQKSARDIKRAVATGTSLSELAAFGWDLSHICERCKGLAPVGALVHVQGAIYGPRTVA
jgi:hypothetical protein